MNLRCANAQRTARLERALFGTLAASACTFLAPDRDDFVNGQNASGGNPARSEGGAAGLLGQSGSSAPWDSGAGNGGAAGAGSGAAGSGGAAAGAELGRNAGAPGFMPAQDTLLWLRADRGIAPTADGAVRQWMDANGTIARQALPGSRPKLVPGAGLPMVEFDGNDYLELPPGFGRFIGLTVFVVASFAPDTPDVCTSLLHFWNDTVDQSDIEFGRHQGRLYYEVSRKNRYSELPLVNEERVLLLEAVHGLDLVATVLLNGTPSGTGEMPLPAMIGERTVNYVGKNAYAECVPLRGRIGEIILYGRALEPSERLRVQDYLRERWASSLQTE